MTVIDLPSGKAYPHFVGVSARLGGARDQSRAQRINLLIDAFEQTRIWMKTKQISPRPEQLPAADLKVLARLLKGEGRLFVEADRQSDIEHALALGQMYGVKIVIIGGQEAWRVAQRLANQNVAVILNPISNTPTNFDRLLTKPNSISILSKRGVNVAISTLSTHNARKLRQWAGNAVRGGLPYPDAIRAITVTPSNLLQLPDRKGIAPGQIADLVVWSGDPLELSSFPTLRISQGKLVDARNRQKALFERYRCDQSKQIHCLPAGQKVP